MVTEKPIEKEPEQIRILQRPKCQRADPPKVNVPETTETVAAVHLPIVLEQKKKNTWSWRNCVDPWSIPWIKKVYKEHDQDHALKTLKSFVHNTWTAKVTPELIQYVKDSTNAETHLILRELQQKLKYIRKTTHNHNTLDLLVNLLTDDGKVLSTMALTDSGCTGSLIDEGFIQQHHIPTHDLPQSIPVYNTDGTPNSQGAISTFVTVELTIREHIKRIALAVTNLGTHLIFLGYNWLKLHNPSIDWNTHKIDFRYSNDHTPGLINKDDDDKKGVESERIFQLDIESYLRSTHSNLATELAIKAGAAKQKQMFEEVVPETYHKYKDIFNKENFDELPPRWPWDHAIELLPGDHTINCKTYNLSPDEQKELDAFLEENLQSGRIWPSKSPFASAFFFVKKKDGCLCPVQDYQKLNTITVKNWYPLPLISELIDKLKKAKFFTKLDIRWGYNNIRMKDGDEWKAVFQTNQGLFEPIVIFFGLTNSPATFQTMMNHLFQDLINQGKVVIYMDDIMIFTKTIEEHRQIVREVLQILWDNKLYLKHTKCEFEQLETEYLGLVVSQNEVKMDPAKVAGVMEWPIPTKRKELQGFLRFLNFYWRFIKNFASIARPLNALTSEKKEFEWTKECQKAFETLKKAITSAPALAMPTDDDPFRIETDGSGIGLGTILSQKQNDHWHPIAFISRSLSNAKWNYHAVDLKMAAIIFAVQEWRHYLLDAQKEFTILTNHKNLEYFRKPQDLSHWQVQWKQIMQEYHYVMEHHSGKTNPANPLSQRPDFEKGVESNNKQEILLPQYLFPDLISEHKDGPLIKDAAAVCTLNSMETRIEKVQYKTESYVREGLKRENSPWTMVNGAIMWKELFYVPKDEKIREEIIIQNHNHPLAGHSGIGRTRDLIMTKYYWPTIRKDVEWYVKGYDTCQWSKPQNKTSTLHPNESPNTSWEIISVDIIGPLPESNGKDAILTIVDCFSKMIHIFLISSTITSKGVAQIFCYHVFKLHGTPKKVISDRGSQFISSFMHDLYALLKIEANPSTAYHPQTDGQTERYNAQIEQYLWIYTNHRQSNWTEWLPLAKFAHNQKITTATGSSPFILNYGQQPQIRENQKKIIWNPAAEDFVETMRKTHKEAKEALDHATEDMKRFYNQKHKGGKEYSIGDLVLLEATNIWSDQPSKKLNQKRYGLFKILKKIGQGAYKLQLDHSWKGIHPVFNKCLLHPYIKGEFPTQKKPPLPLPEIVHQQWEQEINKIINSHEHHGQIEYLVHWKGFPREENEWKKTSELSNALDAIWDFHWKHPTTPWPQQKMQLCLQKDNFDPPCTCPICLKNPTLPSTSKTFTNPDFLQWREQYAWFPDSMFDIPASEDFCPWKGGNVMISLSQFTIITF